jgi:hypothetical protein
LQKGPQVIFKPRPGWLQSSPRGSKLLVQSAQVSAYKRPSHHKIHSLKANSSQTHFHSHFPEKTNQSPKSTWTSSRTHEPETLTVSNYINLEQIHHKNTSIHNNFRTNPSQNNQKLRNHQKDPRTITNPNSPKPNSKQNQYQFPEDRSQNVFNSTKYFRI